MAGTPRGRCDVCDGPLHLLQRTCEGCGTDQKWVCQAGCAACGRETDPLDGPCACGETQSAWRAVEAVTRTAGSVTVAKDAVERPTEAGYRRHVGSIRGQWADYRRVLPGGGECHVRVYLDHYELHVDTVSALDDPAGHTLRYGPVAAVATGTAVVHGVAGAARRAGGLVGSAARTPVSLLSAGDEER